MIETNLSSVFYTCRAVTRGMMKKRAGSIVNVSLDRRRPRQLGPDELRARRRRGSSASRSRSPASSAAAACARTSSRPATSRHALTDVLPEEAHAGDADATRRSAGSASRRTSPGRYASSAPTRPRSSRARCCSSTAGWGCDDDDGSLNGRRRVVITGLGAVTPARQRRRDDAGTAWSPASPAPAPITQFDSSDYPCTSPAR